MAMNTIVGITFIRILFIYSAIKNNANGPAAYLALKPETNSDSPSVRSKGAQLVSARVKINHIMATGHAGTRSHGDSCVYSNDWIGKDLFIRSTNSRMIAIVTLYEIV